MKTLSEIIGLTIILVLFPLGVLFVGIVIGTM